MITLKIEPYCQNCEEFKPETDILSMYNADYGMVELVTEIVCEKRKICQAQYDYLKKQFEKEKKEHE